jgi:hypothetical protein
LGKYKITSSLALVSANSFAYVSYKIYVLTLWASLYKFCSPFEKHSETLYSFLIVFAFFLFLFFFLEFLYFKVIYLAFTLSWYVISKSIKIKF